VHVGHGVLAIGAVDALVIPHAVGKDFHALHGLPRQPLAQLVQVVLVHRLVLRVRNHPSAYLRRVLRCRVLPAVGAAVVYVRQALYASEGQSHGVVLSQVAVRAAARLVLRQPALRGLARDDVDDACDGIASVQCRGGSLHNFYAFDACRVDETEVVLAAVVAVDALAVDEDEDVRVAQAVHLHLRAHVVLVECK